MHKINKNRNSKKNETSKNLASKNSMWIYGKHAVRATLLNPKREVLRLILLESNKNFLEDAISANIHSELIANSNISPEIVDANYFFSLFGRDATHQGCAVLVKKLEENWFSLFKHPDNGPVDLKKTSYYVDFPNLRFIVINTNEIRGIKSLTRMQTWVLECIKTAGSRFTLVMMHHPIYSSCMRRHNLILQLFFRCLKGKADVVFAGHDHNYCRRMPFINTNSSTKYYLNKLNIEDERVACGVQLYSYITVMRDTMTVQAFLMAGGVEYDKIQIVKRARAKELIDYYSQKTDEILLLPQSYTSRKSRKQKIFLERRELRQKGS